jgi:hypothetical protein
MQTNHQTDRCMSTERGALVFWAPPPSPRWQGSKVQIIDVFSLQVATGYTRDPHGKLLLEAQPSVAAGRNWTLAKAAQLIRNDARPHRWVALELNKRAWGLFWAGGGLQRCRERLADRVCEKEACSALVPATTEALLRMVLDLEPETQASPRRTPWRSQAAAEGDNGQSGPIPWKLVAWTSLACKPFSGSRWQGSWGRWNNRTGSSSPPGTRLSSPGSRGPVTGKYDSASWFIH